MNPWDKKKRVYNKSSSVKSFSGNWRDLDWKSLHIECKEAQDSAVETARAENLQRYDEFIANKELEASDEESGAFEGNLSEEYPYRDLSNSRLFQLRIEAGNNITNKFCTDNFLKSFGHILVSEIVKHISTYKLSTMAGEAYDPRALVISKNEHGRAIAQDGMISSSRLYRQIFTDDTMMGIYHFLMMEARSNYLEKQYMAPSKNYCSLVPLVMMAFKLHHGVPYNHWNQDQAVGIVNPKLYSSMLYDNSLGTDVIMDAREQGLLTKTGPSAGTVRNPLHTYKLFGVKGPFSEVPELAQVMLAQIWCAHPANRTKYMILDSSDWDKIPPPLISTEVLAPSVVELETLFPRKTEDTQASNLMPWET